LCTLAALAGGDLVVNEVLYDPPGPDGGREFVEIFNPGPAPVGLDEIRLVFRNGSDPESPATLWVAEPGLVLGSRAYLVVGGDEVEAREASLTGGLQNGDESVELWRGPARIDAVAWGEPVPGAQTWGEGNPVPAARGEALARVPDGRDGDDNASDFRGLEQPTPGDENLPAESFRPVAFEARPVWREDAGVLQLGLSLVADGWAARQVASLELAGRDFALEATPGDTLVLDAELVVPVGAVEVPCQLEMSGRNAVPVDLPELWCGVSDLVVTELQPRPSTGEPEWIELLNRSIDSVPAGEWGLRDRGGRLHRIGTTVPVPPGGRLVLTSDALEFAARYPGVVAHHPEGGWPQLNDTAPAVGVAADSLHLVDPRGRVVDLVTWDEDLIEDRGRSLQRGRVEVGRRSIWMPATGTPSPGMAASDEVRLWPLEALACRPDPFSPDGDGRGDTLELLLVGRWSRSRARVVDLRGDLVRDLRFYGSEDRAAARWDGRDERGRPVPAGTYVVVVECEDAAGSKHRFTEAVSLGRLR
jgi:hypothetical protein